jgi:signal transduction histidine kinase
MIIIDNAINISKEQKIQTPIIDTTVSKMQNIITITISDNCGGIKQKPIDKIFELFESGKSGAGSGIGLAIAHRIIIEKFGGSITAVNSDTGAVFEIKLPAVQNK